MVYDVAGQLKSRSLTQKNQSAVAVLESITYSAAGQVEEELAGNEVKTTYSYEPETQRLSGKRITRPTETSYEDLQDLNYSYDPVGNIIAIEDQTIATNYFRNQKIAAVRTFEYDSLYQLIRAGGRENASNASQSPGLPTLQVPIDPTQVVNYNRTYNYDSGGNLTKISHAGADNYSTTILVSATSNRAVKDWTGLGGQDVESQFDANGNLIELQPGQDLFWTNRNQLQSVTIIERTDDIDDGEYYSYGGDGMRLVKESQQLANGNTTLTQRVIYLPGLELRTKYSGSTETESLEVMTSEAGGKCRNTSLTLGQRKTD